MSVDRPGYWDERYREGNAPWELGRAAPPLVRLLDDERFEPGRAIVVGCGRGHEPAELARRGFKVVGVDWAELAVTEAKKLYPTVDYVRGDVRRLPFPTGSLRYLVEHTCYCAIELADRPAYVREASRVLARGGRILGLFYEPATPGNPPFRVTDADIRRDFGRDFDVERLERPADSTPHRANQEWLAVLRRRA